MSAAHGDAGAFSFAPGTEKLDRSHELYVSIWEESALTRLAEADAGAPASAVIDCSTACSRASAWFIQIACASYHAVLGSEPGVFDELLSANEILTQTDVALRGQIRQSLWQQLAVD